MPILARADLIDFQSFQHTDIKSTFARIRDNPTDNPKIPYDFISSQYRRIIINYTKTYKLPANSGTASTTSKKQNPDVPVNNMKIALVLLSAAFVSANDIPLGIPVTITNHFTGFSLSSRIESLILLADVNDKSTLYAWVVNKDGTISTYDNAATGGHPRCISGRTKGHFALVEGCKASDFGHRWRVKSVESTFMFINDGSNSSLTNEIGFSVLSEEVSGAETQQWKVQPYVV
ncbi:uncharacterized protein LOC110859284 isoform X2 [Folsomia candida]|uniref:uncharacterized protein LOC110859284 isoform X2 n=1 Tax=Folsomia candida TaxID=158441 RepID=UPI001604FC53|nr:uncharacterized protein LOC110859284 isoform X2 [Folsomia candida]